MYINYFSIDLSLFLSNCTEWWNFRTATLPRFFLDRIQYRMSVCMRPTLTCDRVGMILGLYPELQGSIPCDHHLCALARPSSRDLSQFSFGHTRYIKIHVLPQGSHGERAVGFDSPHSPVICFLSLYAVWLAAYSFYSNSQL